MATKQAGQHVKKPNMSKHDATDMDADSTNTAVTRRLKAYYDDITQQAIPDRFMDLLAQLNAAEKKLGK